MTASSEAPPGLRRRSLGVADAEAAYPLSVEAGWNQTVADWRLMLGAGEGIGIADEAGRLVATTLILPFDAVETAPPFGWVSMVLVTKGHRQKGLATSMMRWAMERFAELGSVAMLDATPAGREVYARLGFVAGPTLVRLSAAEPPTITGASSGVRAMDAASLERAIELDRAVFGAGRGQILRALHEMAPQAAFIAEGGGAPRGYVLGRPGRVAFEVGPLVASDAATARDLLGAALAPIAGPVILDAFDAGGWLAGLRRDGFAEQRSFARMGLGAALPSQSRFVFAAAGPELG